MSGGAAVWTVLVPWLLLTWVFLWVSGRRGCGGNCAARWLSQS